ncbi:MAG: hypothetical protein NVSMB1_05480 [Polyangiales bacterium]
MGLREPLLLGLALGVRHALEPDHLAAITTLVSNAPSARSAAGTGAAWGLGHAAAILVFGSVLVVLGVRVPPHLAFTLDIAVAIMLVSLGVHAVISHREKKPHAHAFGEPPTPPSVESTARGDVEKMAAKQRSVRPWRGRSTLVGFVHGASGTAAITLLCLTTLRSTKTAIGFLLLFAAGSLLSMSAMSGLLATPLTALARRGTVTMRTLRVGGGILAFGAAIAVAVGAFLGTT